MARSRSESLLVTVFEGGSRRRRPDELVVEEPMTIQLDGNVASTTMRTPGNDYELAAGFCFSDGLLGGAQVRGVRYCADGAASDSQFNVVTVETGGKAPVVGAVSSFSDQGWLPILGYYGYATFVQNGLTYHATH